MKGLKVRMPSIRIPKMGFKLPKLPALHLFQPSTKILILEIGDEWLKMAGVLEVHGKRKLVHLGVESIQNVTDLEKGEKIARFLKKMSFKPRRVFVLHPAHNLTTRILSLPSTDPDEIRDIIDLQAVKQTPYNKEDITTSFHVIETEASGYSKVLLAISHRDIATAYFETVEWARISPDAINISLEGSRSWYKRLLSLETETAPDSPVLLLDVDWSGTNFLILRGDKMIFSRSMSLGVQHLAEKGEGVEESFVSEVQRSLEFCKAEFPDQTISKVVVTGMSAAIKAMVPALEKELKVPCLCVFNFEPFEGEVAPKVQEGVKGAFCSLAAVLGFAWNPEPMSLNLIPSQIETQKGLEHRAKDLAITGSLLLGIICLASIVFLGKIYKKEQYLVWLKQQYEKVREPSEEVQRAVAKMKLAEDQMNLQGNILDILSDINASLPDDIYLTALQYQANENMVLMRGIAPEMSAVFKLLTTLEETPHLELVKTRNVTKGKAQEKDVAEFEITANVTGSKL